MGIEKKVVPYTHDYIENEVRELQAISNFLGVEINTKREYEQRIYQETCRLGEIDYWKNPDYSTLMNKRNDKVLQEISKEVNNYVRPGRNLYR